MPILPAMKKVRKAVKLAVAPKHAQPTTNSPRSAAISASRWHGVRDWVASRYRVSSDGLEPALVAAEEAARSRASTRC